MDGDEPLDEAGLGGGRGFAFALSEGTHDGHYYIGGHPLGRVEVLDQGGHRGLVKFSLDRGDVYDGTQRGVVQAVFKGMAADGLDGGREVARSLLGLGVGCFPRDQLCSAIQSGSHGAMRTSLQGL